MWLCNERQTISISLWNGTQQQCNAAIAQSNETTKLCSAILSNVHNIYVIIRTWHTLLRIEVPFSYLSFLVTVQDISPMFFFQFITMIFAIVVLLLYILSQIMKLLEDFPFYSDAEIIANSKLQNYWHGATHSVCVKSSGFVMCCRKAFV